MNFADLKTHIWACRTSAFELNDSIGEWIKAFENSGVDIDTVPLDHLKDYNVELRPESQYVIYSLNAFCRNLAAIPKDILDEFYDMFQISTRNYQFVRNEVEHNSDPKCEIELALYIAIAMSGKQVNSTSPYGKVSRISVCPISEFADILDEFYFKFSRRPSDYMKIFNKLDDRGGLIEI